MHRIKTSFRMPGIHRTRKAEVVEADGKPVLVISVHTEISSGKWLVVALRPYNPEGIQFIEQVAFEPSRQVLVVDNRERIYLEETPEKILFSTYAKGDVIYKLEEKEKGNSVRCPVGMVTAAAVHNLQGLNEKRLTIRIPLQEDTSHLIFNDSKEFGSWSSAIEKMARLSLPDPNIQYLYDSAVRTLILLSAGDIVPGPYTYRRFWFRDACFMLNALMVIGLTDRCRRILSKFPTRQRGSDFFTRRMGSGIPTDKFCGYITGM